MTPRDEQARAMALAELYEMAKEEGEILISSLDVATRGGIVDAEELRNRLHNLTRHVTTIARWTTQC